MQACSGDECGYILPERTWKRLQLTSRVPALRLDRPVEAGSKPRLRGLVPIGLVSLLLLLSAWPLAGLVDAIDDPSSRSRDRTCDVADPAEEEDDADRCVPEVADGIGLRVQSEGLLAGPGSWWGERRLILQLRDFDVDETRLALSGPNEVQEVGTLSLQDLGPRLRWLGDLRDVDEQRHVVGSFGDPGRVGLVIPEGDAYDRWAVGDIRGRPVRTAVGPLSQLALGIQVAGLLLLAMRGWRRATQRRIAGWASTAVGLVVGLVLLDWIGPTIPRTLGQLVLEGGYSPPLGVAVLVVASLAIVGGPIGAATASRSTIERWTATRARRTGSAATLRPIAAIAAGATGLLVLQLVDQLLGGLFLGWTP